MKFFRIVLGTTPEGRREGDERDTEGLSCGSALSEATAGATRSSRSAWSFCIVPVSGEGKGVRPLFPTGLGCWGALERGMLLGRVAPLMQSNS